METLRHPLTAGETRTATELVKGTRKVEVPGAYERDKMDPEPEPLTLPEPRLLSDYITAPCKHECGVFKQIRHAKQTHRLLSSFNPIKRSLMRATARQCGLDSAYCHASTVTVVASMDRPGSSEGGSREAALFCASTLHRFGLPVDFARLQTESLP